MDRCVFASCIPVHRVVEPKGRGGPVAPAGTLAGAEWRVVLSIEVNQCSDASRSELQAMAQEKSRQAILVPYLGNGCRRPSPLTRRPPLQLIAVSCPRYETTTRCQSPVHSPPFEKTAHPTYQLHPHSPTIGLQH